MKNPQAFPRVDGLIDRHQGGRTYDVISTDGMTLLDYFAGQALKNVIELIRLYDSKNITRFKAEDVAKYSYDCAEAMLKEREKRNE